MWWEETLAFCYLQQDKDEHNKCVLTSKHLVIIQSGKSQRYEMEHINSLSFGSKRWLLPLVAGGIAGPFSLMAIFLNLYNTWPLFMIFIMSALAFYYGWIPHPTLSVHEKVQEHHFPLSYVSPNLKAFVNFVNQYKNQRSEMIYHVARTEEWVQAQQANSYQAASLQEAGFIHGATLSQLHRLKAHGVFSPNQSWTLLTIDPFKVKSEIRYEKGDDPPGFQSDLHELFPHIYGPLNLDAVVLAEPFPDK